jgi:ASC-1-like (ASCH) protein
MNNIPSTIQFAATHQDDWSSVYSLLGQNVHIAIMSEPYLSHLLSGQKTIESRFTLNKITPYKNVNVGDVVLLKHGPIVGYFIVKWVKTFDLTEYPIEEIAKKYSEALCVDDEFWRANRHKKYATLLGVSDVHKLTPLRIEKHDRRAWLTLGKAF